MCECRGRAATDNGRGFVDKRVIRKSLDHEQGVVHAARDVAGENGIAYVATPHGQPLALTLFKVAATHDCPAFVTGKNAPAGVHLVVQIHKGNDPREPAGDFLLSLKMTDTHPFHHA